VKRKPARKPAKKSSVQLRAGRAEAYLAALEDDLESAENALFDLAWGEVILALRRGAIEALRCDNSRRFEVAEAELRALALSIALATMRFCVAHWRDGIETLAMVAIRDAKIAEQRRDGGESLAEEGRAARKAKTDRHAAQVCQIYNRVRPSFPPGRAGNGAALAEVSRRADPSPGYEKPMTKQGIRKLLKRCGVPCR
jgi:hypothetical protein